jgi:hypothetical protein
MYVGYRTYSKTGGRLNLFFTTSHDKRTSQPLLDDANQKYPNPTPRENVCPDANDLASVGAA